jgi:hypothetical protein
VHKIVRPCLLSFLYIHLFVYVQVCLFVPTYMELTIVSERGLNIPFIYLSNFHLSQLILSLVSFLKKSQTDKWTERWVVKWKSRETDGKTNKQEHHI